MTRDAATPACEGVAVVTGAARGIGAAIVRRLAGSGWSVIAVDRCADDPEVGYPLARPEQLTALAGEFPQVVPLVADVRDAAALHDATALAVRRFGRLDAAVPRRPCCSGANRCGRSPNHGGARSSTWT